MGTKEVIEVGDYVTWGSENTAHKVLGVEEAGAWVSSQSGGEPVFVWDHDKARVVAAASAAPGGWANVVDMSAVEKLLTASPLSPDHYSAHAIQPAAFIYANDLPFWAGNVIKYVCRAGRKVPDGSDATAAAVEDLSKAKRYIEMKLNQLKGLEITAE